MAAPPLEPLPIDALVPEVVSALEGFGAAVLTAPPGSGKSTRVPPALAIDRSRQVLLLQPRRIAARALAGRIAQEQGWRLGEEVGFRVRFERVGNERTGLWVMTEGSLTRQLLADPYLERVACVVLDEFHERSLHLDLALAYLQELRTSVRPDLRLLVMSATLQAGPIAAFLGGAPVISAPGRVHPVAIELMPQDQALPLERRIATAVRGSLLHQDAGDVLVFLPGSGEIRASQRLLEDAGVRVLPLHGQLTAAEQDAALRPDAVQRVVLATNVARDLAHHPGGAHGGGQRPHARGEPRSRVRRLRALPQNGQPRLGGSARRPRRPHRERALRAALERARRPPARGRFAARDPAP